MTSGSKAPLLANRKVMAMLIALLFISVAVIGYISATSSTISSTKLPVVEYGDLVYVNYIGTFVDNPGGWVFDTNERIAAYNVSLEKSLFFSLRDDAQYVPLNFTAGVSENYLKPFVDGVLGMSVYQTKRVYVPIEEGYSLVTENIESFPLVMEAPIYQNYSYAEFLNAYKVDPSIGLSVKHVFWGWDCSVYDIIGDKIILQSHPVVGQIVSGFGDPAVNSRDGWYQKVLEVNQPLNTGNGIIKVQNLITPQDIYQKKGTNPDKKLFTLLDVNETMGTFTVIYNTPTYIGELAGRALYFDITITAVKKV
jgi:FKBP-type peptidyl-prolyl cis-trans isomerase 2